MNIGVVGVPASTATGIVLYLGTGERAPDIDIKPEYGPVNNDLAGSVKIDSIFGGESGHVSVVLTRYNELVLATLQDYVLYGAGSIRGTDDPGDVGTLMLTEGQSFGLILQFPNVAKAAYSTMPPGYFFPAVYSTSDRIQGGTTQAKKVSCTFECLRTFDPTIVTGEGSGRFVLYTNILPALPPID